jgi:hypothetical protein
MKSIAIILTSLLLLATLPAAAQSPDPFRSTAPAPAPAPRPRPAPTYPSEPAVVAPQPAPPPAAAAAPSLPSASQIWTRVREVAQAQGISVPLSGTRPLDETGTPQQYRALLGAWGPGTWQGDPGGDKAILVVESVDSSGYLHVVAGKSSGKTVPAAWVASVAPIAGDRFTLQISYSVGGGWSRTLVFEETWQFEFRPDGKLYGARNGKASSIVLDRLR